MSTTQSPPVNPTPPARRPEGVELYDARYWESAYRELHDAPALLIQLQDDLSRSRKREAVLISVVVHMVVVLLIFNSSKFERFLPRRNAILVSANPDQEKDLTYLELRPSAQKLTKRPDTNIISDKDRSAMSKAPQLDRQELKKILDSSRPGRPGLSAPPAAQPAPAGGQSVQGPQSQAPPAPAPSQDQVAKLQTPAMAIPKPSFSTGNMSAGAAIAKATAQPRPIVAATAGMTGTMAPALAVSQPPPWARSIFSATPWAWTSALTWRACCMT